jgi:hypothetical protein
MFEPVRGGTRGGQAEFKWSDVSADKDREVVHSLYSLQTTDPNFFRITLGIASMLQQDDGKRTRTFTGTTEKYLMVQRNELRK